MAGQLGHATCGRRAHLAFCNVGGVGPHLQRNWKISCSRRRSNSSSVEVVVKSRRDENLIPPSQLRQRMHPTSPGKPKTEVAAPAAEPASARSSLQQPAAAAAVQSICARKQTTRVDHRVRRRRRNIGAACEGASWCGAQWPVTKRARAPYLPCRRRVQGMRTIAQGTHNANLFGPGCMVLKCVV